jgi:hypothetical protein
MDDLFQMQHCNLSCLPENYQARATHCCCEQPSQA